MIMYTLNYYCINIVASTEEKYVQIKTNTTNWHLTEINVSARLNFHSTRKKKSIHRLNDVMDAAIDNNMQAIGTLICVD